MYETRTEPLIDRRLFLRRVGWHVGIATLVIGLSLVAGMVGFIGIDGISIPDAFLNAAMLLGGMGPVNVPQTTTGKVFAGCYALYAGLMFVATAGLMFTPILHRLLHKFHWEDD